MRVYPKGAGEGSVRGRPHRARPPSAASSRTPARPAAARHHGAVRPAQTKRAANSCPGPRAARNGACLSGPLAGADYNSASSPKRALQIGGRFHVNNWSSGRELNARQISTYGRRTAPHGANWPHRWKRRCSSGARHGSAQFKSDYEPVIGAAILFDRHKNWRPIGAGNDDAMPEQRRAKWKSKRETGDRVRRVSIDAADVVRLMRPIKFVSSFNCLGPISWSRYLPSSRWQLRAPCNFPYSF